MKKYQILAFVSVCLALAVAIFFGKPPGQEKLRAMVFDHHVPDRTWFDLQSFEVLQTSREGEDYMAKVRYRLHAKRDAMEILETRLKAEGLSLDGKDEKSVLRRKEIGGGIAGAFGNFRKGDVLEITEEVHLLRDPKTGRWRINYTFRAPDGLVYLKSTDDQDGPASSGGGAA